MLKDYRGRNVDKCWDTGHKNTFNIYNYIANPLQSFKLACFPVHAPRPGESDGLKSSLKV